MESHSSTSKSRSPVSERRSPASQKQPSASRAAHGRRSRRRRPLGSRRDPGFGYGLFRSGETWDRHFQPVAVFHRRPVALLAAAVLPGTGRDAAFRLADKLTAAGFAITDSAGQLAGHSALFNKPLVAALHIVESIISAPESLANLLEAAGSLALERAGAILDQRFPAE